MHRTPLVFPEEQIIAFTKRFTLFNIVIIGIPFIIIWGAEIFEQIKDLVELLMSKGILAYFWVFIKICFWIMIGLFGGTIAHELLHAVIFMLFAKKGVKSIKFGFIEKPFFPYVHCKEELSTWKYRIALMAPGVLLGVIPCIIGLWNGSLYSIAFGIIFTSSAAGDLMLLTATRGIGGHKMIRDLPDQMGFVILG